MTSNPWPARSCKCCGQERAAPGWYQCEFCIHVDPTADRKAKIPAELVALADVERRATFRIRMLRGQRAAGQEREAIEA